ncbi:hypothetical protein C2I18_03225 [Paenibacillus sp. PK3_47]|uniref:DinB family protein n=1 Tax=Paenibacillus sp. PK3_47 TaxID=2072642 RepID=UPI00201E1EF4|nr:DUF1572 family protein [Paenibacillus sp. PK3_47]UQZ32655.1 hypothetical protein C2I18_03225 [Paenibacillus sp. PK3_47]
MIPLITYVLEDMNKQLERMERSLNLLNEDLVWNRTKTSMNSIGNLCLHLAGNEYQNVVSAIGNRPFVRERTREFTAEGGMSKEELIRLLRATRSQSEEILSALTEEDLSREVIIRFEREDWNRMHRSNASEGETCDTRVIGRLLVQVAAHYGYHAGQIVVLAKMLQDNDVHVSGQYH